MRCRKIIDGNVVWFGSAGTKHIDGESIQLPTFEDFDNGTTITLERETMQGQTINVSGSLLNVDSSMIIDLYDDNTFIQRITIDESNTDDTERFDIDNILQSKVTKMILSGHLTTDITFTISFKPYDKAILVYDKSKKEQNSGFNFSDKQQAVSDSLTQRLSVIKTELWYNVTYGLPLYEKVKSKEVIDSNVLSIVDSHPDVVTVKSFQSKILNSKYSCDMQILTIYGDVNLQI